MGGSGTIGDVIGSILSKEDIHVTNVKGYILPKTVDSETLVVVTSVSGNTDETLTILDAALKTSAKIVAFSSGGIMEEFCKKNDIFFQNISLIHSPRASLAGFLFAILNILENLIPINHSDVVEAISILKETRNNISSNNLSKTNQAIELAKYIKKIPCIYYPAGLQSASIRFKNSLQENTKTHVITEDIIESCHNGIVSWEKDVNAQAILIEGFEDNVKTKERWKIIKQYFIENQIDYISISSGTGNILSKIMHLIYLFDYASIYLAVLRKIDPTPVDSIEFIKNKLL
jgi:glucose/mannose-6-phosphate isomerase